MKATLTFCHNKFMTSAYTSCRGAPKIYPFPAQTCSEIRINQFCSQKRALCNQSASTVGNPHCHRQSCSNPSYNFHYSSSFTSNHRYFSSHLISGLKPASPTSTIQSSIMSEEEQRMEAKAFAAIFPAILKDVTENSIGEPEMNEAFKWFSEAIQYNVPNGKKNRGLMVVLSYKVLMGLDNCSPSELMLARILGWCVEMLQAYFLVYDDIMDQSVTRRGSPCWYQHENVGMMAINDGIWMENSIYYILKKHFSNMDCYTDLVNLFIECTRKTSLGQCLDMLSNPPNKRVDLSSFTPERHAAIAKYKTAFYSFSLPVRLALYLVFFEQMRHHLMAHTITSVMESELGNVSQHAGYREERIHAKAESILIKIGHMFQVQDDFLDCFGDPSVTGKIGTDIEDGKCSWLIVSALTRVSDAQRKILEENYGIQNPKCAEKVKEVYNELKLQDLYFEYEANMYEEVVELIRDIPESDKLRPQIFYNIIEKIYKRKK